MLCCPYLAVRRSNNDSRIVVTCAERLHRPGSGHKFVRHLRSGASPNRPVKHCGHVAVARRFLLDGWTEISHDSFLAVAPTLKPGAFMRIDLPFHVPGYGIFKEGGVYHYPSVSQSQTTLKPTDAHKQTALARLSYPVGARLNTLAPGWESCIQATNGLAAYRPRRRKKGEQVGTRLCDCTPRPFQGFASPLRSAYVQVLSKPVGFPFIVPHLSNGSLGIDFRQCLHTRRNLPVICRILGNATKPFFIRVC